MRLDNNQLHGAKLVLLEENRMLDLDQGKIYSIIIANINNR